MARLSCILLLLSLVACDSSGPGEPETLEWEGTYRGSATTYTFEESEIDTTEEDVVLDVAMADAEALDSLALTVSSPDGDGEFVFDKALTLTTDRLVTPKTESLIGDMTFSFKTRLTRSTSGVSGTLLVEITGSDEMGVWPDSVRREFSQLD